MARRAIILLVGTLLATATCPAVATSQTFQQSSVDNQQIQNADVNADQTLNVVTADPTTATTSAGANGYSAQVQSGSLDVESVQNANGNVSANAVVNVGNSSGSTVITTSATGNTGANDSLGYADLTGTLTQNTGAVSIDAESQLNAGSAAASNISHSVQAIGNSQEISAVGGSATMTVNQSNQASVQANGGAVIGYTGDGASTFSSVTTGNNIAFNGSSGATSALTLNQSNTGSLVQASQFVNAGNGQTIASLSDAIANNISVYNDNNPLNVASTQSNSTYVRAQTDETAYEFGTGSASANGVGNSLVVGNPGGDLTLNNNQINTGGGVEVISSFGGTGGLGYDGSSSAIAMGNAVTGFACSTCVNRMTVTNRQTNNTGVSATSTLTMSAPNSAATGVATAMGNTATFYVSQPDN
jgi:hypothetical protein